MTPDWLVAGSDGNTVQKRSGDYGDSALDLAYPTYFHLLADAHRRLRPKRYLEIGVNEGHSLRLGGPETRIVGVDPAPQVWDLNHSNWEIISATSAEFFRRSDVTKLLGGPVDLAFVDGLHHFEVALADVLSVERYAHASTVVLLHDVLPIDAITSERKRTTAIWSGDVWKVVVLLRHHRPDLSVSTLGVGPTGMAVITGFGQLEETLPDQSWVQAGVEGLLTSSYEDLCAMGIDETLAVVAGTPRSLAGCIDS